MKRLVINTGKWLIMVLFMSYYISTTCFYHTHYFSWGQITHSHPSFPFDKGAANHTHTQDACETIEHLSNILIVLAAAITLSLSTRLIQSGCSKVYRFISYFKNTGPLLRGPPYSFVIG